MVIASRIKKLRKDFDSIQISTDLPRIIVSRAMTQILHRHVCAMLAVYVNPRIVEVKNFI